MPVIEEPEEEYDPFPCRTEPRVTTPEKAEEFRRKAHKRARIFGFAYLADDFASDAVLRWLQGRKARITNLLVDYLRNEFKHRRYGFELVNVDDFSNNIDSSGMFVGGENPRYRTRVERLGASEVQGKAVSN